MKYFANPIEKGERTYYLRGKVNFNSYLFLNVRTDLILQ